MDSNLFIGIIVLVMSVVIHELSHGYVATIWGDMTPRLQGRLTLNPIKHLDLMGSFIVPVITMTLGAGIFGWAKPVVINPHNFRDRRWGEFWTAIAGPISNILIAVLFAMILRFFADSLPKTFNLFSLIVVYTNITLAIFNLMPIPPLDGSKILFTLFPKVFDRIRDKLERYFFVFLFIFAFFLWNFLSPIINKVVLWLI
ncbi:MAG: site-2 protease family protein [bacterium]|nr:site-2 protease family protein [bacterium]